MSTSVSRAAELAAAGKTIGVGIVGLSADKGWARATHVPAIRAVDGYELRALSASSPAAAARSGEVHGVPATFTSAAELAACDEVDLVVVTVKVPEHRELVTAALDAGKAVLCEWPLGNGLAETEKLAELARQREIPTAVGLQARSNPALTYLRDLIQDGYVGEVLSTSILGFGMAWGATVFPGGRYGLDPANGATVRTIPFGHTVDGLAWVLGEPEQLRVEEALRRTTAFDPATGEKVPVKSPDQVWATGTLPGGAVVTMHFRGGSSREENLRWEINGTEGDIIVTAGRGNPQLVGPLTIRGGRGSDTELSELTVPGTYNLVPSLDSVADGPVYAVAHAYHHFLNDLRHGTAVVPDFAHAVVRHRSIEPAISL